MIPVRVVAYNLEFGGRKQLAAIQEVLAQLDADVVGLTEADDREVVETLAKRLGYHHVWAEGSGDRHIATLSRFPIDSWQIYNRHPLAQAILETRLTLPDGALTIYNVHFLPYLLLPFELHRWWAAGALTKMIRQQRPGRHLIMGDLNAVGAGDRVLQKDNPIAMQKKMRWQLGLVFRLALPRLLRAGYVDCFRHLHPNEDGFTWYTREKRTTRYDYVLADVEMAAGLRVCRVVNEITAVYHASDHFPLLAEFEIG